MNTTQIAMDFLQLSTTGKIAEAYERFIAADFCHHNPYFKGDATSLRQGMEENHQRFPNKKLEIKHVVADGELVAIHSRIQLAPEMVLAVVHLFRFSGDRIAELWDVGQSIPEIRVNENSMF